MTDNSQEPNIQEQFDRLQQLLQQQQQDFLLQFLQRQQQTQQQPAAETDWEPSSSTPPAPRPKFEWYPTPELIANMDLDQDLFVGLPLTDKNRAGIIDQYAPMAHLEYRPPDSLPEAYSGMTDAQRSHDQSLKSVQYLLSAVFRPLDLLAYFLANDESLDAQRLKMVYDTRSLLLNASYSINNFRNNIAFKSVNKAFKPNLTGDHRYTMPVDQFNTLVGQLHSTQKAMKEAKHFGKKPFRQGPLSQQGGKTSNNVSNNNQNHNSNSNCDIDGFKIVN